MKTLVDSAFVTTNSSNNRHLLQQHSRDPVAVMMYKPDKHMTRGSGSFTAFKCLSFSLSEESVFVAFRPSRQPGSRGSVRLGVC